MSRFVGFLPEFNFHLILYYMPIAPLQYFAQCTAYTFQSQVSAMFDLQKYFKWILFWMHHWISSYIFLASFCLLSFIHFKNRLLSRRTRFLSPISFNKVVQLVSSFDHWIEFFFQLLYLFRSLIFTKTNGFLWASQSVLRISFVYWWLHISFGLNVIW